MIDSNEHWRDYIIGWQAVGTYYRITWSDSHDDITQLGVWKREEQLPYHITYAWCCKRTEVRKQITHAGGEHYDSQQQALR